MVLGQKPLIRGLGVGIVACFLSSGGMGLPVQKGVESTKVQPLDLKKGYWELTQSTSTTGVKLSVSTADLEKLYATLSPEQREKAIASFRAQEVKLAEKLKKGTETKSKQCPLDQDFLSNVRLDYGERCPREIHSSGERLAMHITCHKPDGTLGSEQINIFERIDAENFKGSIQIIDRGEAPHSATLILTGKWIREACHP